jgi:hypothetical protein
LRCSVLGAQCSYVEYAARNSTLSMSGNHIRVFAPTSHPNGRPLPLAFQLVRAESHNETSVIRRVTFGSRVIVVPILGFLLNTFNFELGVAISFQTIGDGSALAIDFDSLGIGVDMHPHPLTSLATLHIDGVVPRMWGDTNLAAGHWIVHGTGVVDGTADRNVAAVESLGNSN